MTDELVDDIGGRVCHDGSGNDGGEIGETLVLVLDVDICTKVYVQGSTPAGSFDVMPEFDAEACATGGSKEPSGDPDIALEDREDQRDIQHRHE